MDTICTNARTTCYAEHGCGSPTPPAVQLRPLLICTGMAQTMLLPCFSPRAVLVDDGAMQTLPKYGLLLIYGVLALLVSSVIIICITALGRMSSAGMLVNSNNS